MVLFIPGFMQRGDAWRPVAELLPERYPSVLLDHGEHTLEGRLREIAEAASAAEAGAGPGRIRRPGRARREICRPRSPAEPSPGSGTASPGAPGSASGSVVLVGYSLGGRLALRAAIREPQRYAGLIAVSATAGIDEPATRVARAEADERLAAWMEATPIVDIVAIWERQPLFADQSDALVEDQRPGRLSHDPAALALLLRTAGQGVLEPVWHELLRLDLPVLAIAGDRDEGYVRAARRIAETAPRGRAAIVEEAGHAAHLQRPDEVARLITEFLDAEVG
ncbi:MAG: alpha/beta fold hydrolase [Thermoleophilaceae bacterium]|nr:alpha/beta fold hydrolase [Thermoleophilaceae bacterium]